MAAIETLLKELNSLSMKDIQNLSNEELNKLRPILSSKERIVTLVYKERRAKLAREHSQEKK